jgi:hypothetical protein
MRIARPIFVLLLSFQVLQPGCKKDDDSPTSPGATGVPAALVGTWTLQSATLNGQPADLATLFEWVQGTESATVKIEANGSYTYTELNGSSQVLFTNAGTFTVTGSNFTVSITSANGQPLQTPEGFAGTWAVNGNTVSLTIASPLGQVVVTGTK